MNYSGADAFTRGLARGFGIINSAIQAKENREYRKELLGMQKEKFGWEKNQYLKEQERLETAERARFYQGHYLISIL